MGGLVRKRCLIAVSLCCRMFTIYTRVLPLDVACRVWDMFCRDGDSFLFRTALGKMGKEGGREGYIGGSRGVLYCFKNLEEPPPFF